MEMYGIRNCLKINNGTAKTKELEDNISLTKSPPCLKSIKHKETIVSINGGTKGCYFSRTQVVVFISAFLLTVGVVIFLVLFFGTGGTHVRHYHSTNNVNCNCKDMDSLRMDPDEVMTIRLNSTERQIQRDTLPRTEPRFDIRLPGDIVPIHYSIDLDIDLDKVKDDSTIFHGAVKMLVKILGRTRYVVFHFKPFSMTIARENVSIKRIMSDKPEQSKFDTDTKYGETVEILRHSSDFMKELYILELKSFLTPGLYYSIEIGTFSGTILRDLKGIYLSYYRDTTGSKRSENLLQNFTEPERERERERERES